MPMKKVPRGDLTVSAAREMAKPIREEYRSLSRFARDLGPSSDFGIGIQMVLDRIAPLIFISEELNQ